MALSSLSKLKTMAEELQLNATGKKERYQELLPQVEALLDGETDLTANMANVCAALRQAFGFFWVGFYIVRNNELVLGPFQGPVACTRIKKGKGVCGAAWEQATVLVVPDVDKFTGHIACSSLSKSEIVIPLFGKTQEVVAVLDVDSDKLDDFVETVRQGLARIAALLRFN